MNCIINILSFLCNLQQEAAAAAQNSSIENTSNLAASNPQPPQQPPNNVSSQPGPGSQSLPQNNQQSMRPISSPNSSSSGSRSMSPAVGKFLVSFLTPQPYIHELFTAKKREMCLWLGGTLLWSCMVWGRRVKGCFSRFHLTPLQPRLKDFFHLLFRLLYKRKKN